MISNTSRAQFFCFFFFSFLFAVLCDSLDCKRETRRGAFGRRRGCTLAFHRLSLASLTSPVHSLSEPCSCCCGLSPSLPPSFPLSLSSVSVSLCTACGLRAEDLLCRCSLFLLSFTVSSEDHIHSSTHTFSNTKVSLKPV